MKKANSRGTELLYKLRFSYVGCPRKNKPLFVKYFLDDYKLIVIEILYTRGGQFCSYKGLHLKKKLKNFKAKGRTDWKSKKKVYMSADVLFSPLKIKEEQKKRSTRLQMSFFALTFSAEPNKKKKKVLGLIYDKSLYSCKCPQAA